MGAKITTLVDMQGDPIAPRTGAAAVTTASGESVEDALAKKASTELLWTNPDPAADFATQTITIPEAANYSSFAIDFRISIASSIIRYYLERSIHEGSAVNCHFGVPYSNGSTWSASIITRKVTLSSGDFVITDCSQYRNGASSTAKDNSMLLPYRIYGIK